MDNNHKKIKELGEDLQTLRLTCKVKAKQIDDANVELQVGRLLRAKKGGARDLVNISDVGHGFYQAREKN
ncbi:hypothetical protein GMMP15_380009 [Candidatus Magnetomoraceae bacterium gMMP-15]